MAEKLKFEIYAKQNLGGSWARSLQNIRFKELRKKFLKRTRSAQTNTLSLTHWQVMGEKWRCQQVRVVRSACAVVLSCQIDWRK